MTLHVRAILPFVELHINSHTMLFHETNAAPLPYGVATHEH